MNKEKLKDWFIDTSIRAIKTMAETASGIVVTASYMGQVDWKMVVSATVLSGIACFLVNVKNLPGGEVREDAKEE